MLPKEIGRWKIGNRIGRGGQARVFECSSGEGKPICALKVIQTDYPKKRARFIQETQKHMELSAKKAPNIIEIIDQNLVDFENGQTKIGYIVMPKAETNLEPQISLLRNRTEFCLEIFRGITYGIKGAHTLGVIHRDLKPSNILFLKKSLRAPLISDFGICFIKDTPDERRLTDVDETVGAKFFMSPEQERGAPPHGTNPG